MTYERLDRRRAAVAVPERDRIPARRSCTSMPSRRAHAGAAAHPSNTGRRPSRRRRSIRSCSTTGRSLYEFNAGTMTGRCRTRELRPSDLLEIAPVDAEMAGVRDGDLVRLVSRYGSAMLPIRVTPAIRPGELFATFHTVDIFLNNVTGSERDRTVGTPE